MKKMFLAATIGCLLLSCTAAIQAQTADTTLNQVELMKQFLGTWRTDLPEGEAMVWEIIPFGSSMTAGAKYISQNAVTDITRYLWGYDKKSDKIIVAEIFNDTPRMELDVLWFTSSGTVEGVLQKDINDPENAVIKFKFEFKSSDSFIFKYLRDNNIVTVLEWNRINE